MTTKTVIRRGLLPPSASVQITPDELNVLALMAVGLDDPSIAEQLKISGGDVGKILRAVFAKLNARERTHAVAMALKLGVLSLGNRHELLLKDPTLGRVLDGWNSFPMNAKQPTERELQILALLREGTSTQMILTQLQISRTAFDGSMGGIRDNTFARDKTHAMVIVMRLGWLPIRAETA